MCLTNTSSFATYKNGIILFKVQKKKKKKKENKNIMMLSKCAICGIKKSRFIKQQDAKGLLSKLVIKTPLSKIPKLGHISF